MVLFDILFAVWSFVKALVPFFVLLGVLVFIHEWGHFVVARFFKVRVEVFSLGFGKKILKWKKGSTLYSISAIPLGGYVKMFGDQYGQKVSPQDKKDSFLHKKLYQRTLVVLAGPLMNFFLAVLIFATFSMVGEQEARPLVSEVEEGSLAQKAGFKAQDLLVSVNQKPLKNLKEFDRIIFKNSQKPLSITVKRDHRYQTLSVVPEKKPLIGEYGLQATGGVISGLSYFTAASFVGVDDPESAAGKAGFQTFDEIVSIDNKPVFTYNQLALALKTPGGYAIQVKREGKTKPLFLDIKSPENLKNLGFHKPNLFVADLKSGGQAQKAGLKKGDRIVKINNSPVTQWPLLVERVKNFNPEKEKHLKLGIIREGEFKEFLITPHPQSQLINGKEQTRYMLGVVSGMRQVPAGGIYTHRTLNPFKALSQGFLKTLKWCQITGIYIKKLIVGEVSRKALGGAIHIGREAYKSYSYGLKYFFIIMAVLSIQLCLVNLLPVPILDGGHLVFYAVEFFKGSPMSMRKMIMFQYLGLVFILTLVIFTTFNDVHNWIHLW